MPSVQSKRTTDVGNGWFQVGSTAADSTVLPMYVGRNSVDLLVVTWMHFTGLNIPAGSTINSATFTTRQNTAGTTDATFQSEITFQNAADPPSLEGSSQATHDAAYNARVGVATAVSGVVAEGTPLAYDVTAALQAVVNANPGSNIVSAILMWHGLPASGATVYCRPDSSTAYNHALDVTYTVPVAGISGDAAGVLPALAGAAAGQAGPPATGDIAGSLPALAGAALGFIPATGDIAGVLPAMAGAASGDVAGMFSGTIAATLPALAGQAAGAVDTVGASAGALPPLAGAAAGDSGTLAVALTDLMADEIRPMAPRRRSCDVRLAGTYNGAVGAIEARVVDHATAAVIVDWTTLDAAPAGGTFAGTLAVPAGFWYRAEVRAAADIGVTDSGVNRWAVGVLIALTGQSNGMRLTTEVGTVTLTTAQPVRVFSSVTGDLPAGAPYNTWHEPTGQGVLALANLLGDRLGCPVGVLQDCVSGAALRSEANAGTIGWWWDGSPAGASIHWTRLLGHINDLGGDLTAMVWIQGEREAQTDIAPSTHDKYVAAFTDFLASYVRPATRADLPVFITTLPRFAGAGTDRWDDVIRAEFDLIDTLPDVYHGADTRDLLMNDNVHLHVDAEDEFGQRIARSILDYMGEGGYSRAPRPVSYTQVSPTVVDVHLRMQGGYGLRGEGAASYAGFQVYQNTTQRTITSAVRVDERTIRVSFDLAANPQSVRFLYGANPPGTGPAANQPRDDGPMALPLEPVGIIQPRRAVTYTVVDRNGNARPNLSGLRWAFYEAHQDQGGAPSDTGTAATNGDGSMTVTLTHTYLKAGATGWLMLTDAAGANTAAVQVTLA